MKPPRLDYFAPTTLDEAISLLCQYGDDAKVIAGGQSLMPLLNMRLARPSALIDINRIPTLNYISVDDSGISVGGTVTERQLERDPAVAESVPFLADLVKWIGHPQIRNRGTVCGSIVHADPAAELPAGAVALDAELTVQGPRGVRQVAADDFFLGYLDTTLEPSEIVTAVRFPALATGTGWSVQEVARRHGDFALAGAIALIGVESGRISSASVVSFGTGGRPLRFPAVDAMLTGSAPSAALFERVGRTISQLVDPPDDVHATADYRRKIAGVLVRRALEEALRRATGERP